MMIRSTTSKHKHIIHNRDVLQTMWEGSTKQLLLMMSPDDSEKRGETTSWRSRKIWRKKKVNSSIFLYSRRIWQNFHMIIMLWTRLVFQHILHKSIFALQINSVIVLDNQNKYGNLYHSFRFQFTGPHHKAFTCKHCITNYI